MKKVIGIDLGGTKINGGIVNGKGEILKKLTIETQSEEGRKTVLRNIKNIIKELMEHEKIEGIGIGSPGFIDTENGKVVYNGGNITDWAGVEIRNELLKEFKDLPILVENDANVAIICEEWIGVGKGLNTLVMITLGTGVGGGIWSKEQGIWHGYSYQGAELGHSILYPMGRQCNCGQNGCVEQYISGRGIEKSYFDRTGKELKGVEIFKNKEKDEICNEVVDKFVRELSTFLISIKNIFDPEGLIIGGGVINSKEYWWEDMLKYYKANCNNSRRMEILPAKYLNDSGVIGAAKLVFDNNL